MVRVDEAFSKFSDILDEVFRIVPVVLSQEGYLQCEELIRTRLIFFELSCFFGSSPNIFPYLLHVALQFPSALALVRDFRVGVPQAKKHCLWRLLLELIDADPQNNRQRLILRTRVLSQLLLMDVDDEKIGCYQGETWDHFFVVLR